MDDQSIVELYLQRDENAIKESRNKYEAYCYRIAMNILSVAEDVEECINDTWISVWNRIPPVIPKSLKAFLGKLVRDISLSRYRAVHAKKRYNGMELILDELAECIPSEQDIQESLEQKELSGTVNGWLDSLPQEDRVLFVKRYYYGETVKQLSEMQSCTENQMAQKMMKLRNKLKAHLLSGGVLE
ncbi:MAG: sigma-70 family RNA polymerase sigma factor [Oscillospiraceae bacterium]|nr:sigma-70 family RNA polymerase sigma factor [Oscillospiraceae bacterium]